MKAAAAAGSPAAQQIPVCLLTELPRPPHSHPPTPTIQQNHHQQLQIASRIVVCSSVKLELFTCSLLFRISGTQSPNISANFLQSQWTDWCVAGSG